MMARIIRRVNEKGKSSVFSIRERIWFIGLLIYDVYSRKFDDLQTNWIFADSIGWLFRLFSPLKRQKDHLQTKTQQTNNFADLPYECVQILEYVEQHQRITVREAEAFITTIARPTIKNRFAQLVELGLLERKGKGRGVWYAKV